MRHVDLKLLYNVIAEKRFINKTTSRGSLPKTLLQRQRSWCTERIIELWSRVRCEFDGTSPQNSAAAAAAAELMADA